MRIARQVLLLALLGMAAAPPAGAEEGGLLVMSSAVSLAGPVEALFDEGGTAVDVAIAAALLQVVACGGAWSSLAGIAAWLHIDAPGGAVSSLVGGFARPARADTRWLVPGMVPALAAAHARHGRLPWSRLVAPAIAAAEEGVPVGEPLARLLAWRGDALREAPFVFAGGRLRQPALALTLRTLAAQGPTSMTRGTWAQAFAALDGAPTLSDLDVQPPPWTAPLSGRFADHTLRTVAPPALGGLCLLESLALLEGSALQPPRSPATVARMVRAGEPCYAAFLASAADPAARLAPARIQSLRAMLDRGLPLADRLTGLPSTGHSDIVVAVDRAGRTAVLAHSIHGALWGGTAPRFVAGVALSDAARSQAVPLRHVASGAMLPNALNPTLLQLADGRMVAMASIGGSLAELMLQATVELAVDGATPRTLVQGTHYLQPLWPSIGVWQSGCLLVLVLLAPAGALLLQRGPAWLRVLALLAWLPAAVWTGAVLWAASSGSRTLLAVLDTTPVLAAMVLGAAALLLAAGLAARRASPLQRLAIGALALVLLATPWLLRGSLVPVTLVPMGRFDAATLEAWRRAGLAVAEVAPAEAPLGYWAGVAWPRTPGAPLQAAVTPGLGGGVFSAKEAR